LGHTRFSSAYSESTDMITCLPIFALLAVVLVLNKTQTGYFF
jgi:hypothetical protein